MNERLTRISFPALRTAAVGCCLAVGCLAQSGTAPKLKPEEYPVHVALGTATLAAQYLAHSIVTPRGVLPVDDYLVVEVALYVPKGMRVALAQSQFQLRVNGKSTPLLSQAATLVGSAVRHPDMSPRGTVLTAGMGDAGIILGRTPPTSRFPNDPRPAGERLPAPPGVPQASQGKAPVPEAGEETFQLSLPEGSVVPPVSGYVYFPSPGRRKQIRSLELLYEGPLGKAAIRVL